MPDRGAWFHGPVSKYTTVGGCVLLYGALALSSPVGSAGAEAGWEAMRASDYATAEAAWRPQAEAGDAAAQADLATLYYTLANFAEAARWFEAAAEQGRTNAEVMIASMYQEGRGVPRDYVRAYMWYGLAAAAGHPKAAEARDLLATRMTPDEVVEGERLIRERQGRR